VTAAETVLCSGHSGVGWRSASVDQRRSPPSPPTATPTAHRWMPATTSDRMPGTHPVTDAYERRW